MRCKGALPAGRTFQILLQDLLMVTHSSQTSTLATLGHQITTPNPGGTPHTRHILHSQAMNSRLDILKLGGILHKLGTPQHMRGTLLLQGTPRTRIQQGGNRG